MKKYILPTLTVIAVALGIFIGSALTQKANAQRIIYQNGQWSIEPTKVDRLLQLMESMFELGFLDVSDMRWRTPTKTFRKKGK